MSKQSLVTDILLILSSVFFAVGTGFLFTACGPKEDGSFMACHWAWLAVLSIAVVLAVQSVLRLFFRSSEAKKGLSAAMLPTAVLAAVIPGNIINLCMMNTMHCHTTMKPFALVMGIVIAVLSAVDIIINSVGNKKTNG